MSRTTLRFHGICLFLLMKIFPYELLGTKIFFPYSREHGYLPFPVWVILICFLIPSVFLLLFLGQGLSLNLELSDLAASLRDLSFSAPEHWYCTYQPLLAFYLGSGDLDSGLFFSGKHFTQWPSLRCSKC